MVFTKFYIAFSNFYFYKKSGERLLQDEKSTETGRKEFSKL
jgi:hypothetical protein